MLEVNQFVFDGALNAGRPFRALFAGGGTGDGTLLVAAQAKAMGLPGEVVHLDISSAALKIAQRRAERRQLQNIRFVQGSLLDLEQMALGSFDYIDCSGVLHHLSDPDAGLRALCGALAPGGGIGLMLYGEYGRTGLYHIQHGLRLLTKELTPTQAIARARRFVAGLPPTAWANRNPQLAGDNANLDDTEFYDRYLHSQDRAYTVGQLYQMAWDCDLEVTGLVTPGRYDPRSYLPDEELSEHAATLPPGQAAELAELLDGDMAMHSFYLRPGSEGPQTPLGPEMPSAIPVLRHQDQIALAAKLPFGTALRRTYGGREVSFEMRENSAAIIALIDGQRSLSEIHDTLRGEFPKLTGSAFMRDFAYLYNILHRHMFQLFLSRTPINSK
jgi:SAM-dependent methyltransferase